MCTAARRHIELLRKSSKEPLFFDGQTFTMVYARVSEQRYS